MPLSYSLRYRLLSSLEGVDVRHAGKTLTMRWYDDPVRSKKKHKMRQCSHDRLAG